jgi:phosphoribosyl-AMP cyclohydrolase
MSSSKRHFTVVMNSKEHGLYVSSTPSSAARKAVSKLCADNKKKKVEFCMRETTQGSNKKIYGPYLGEMKKLDKPVELKGRTIKYAVNVHLKKKSSTTKPSKKVGSKLRGGRIEQNGLLEADDFIYSNKNLSNSVATKIKKRLLSKNATCFFIKPIVLNDTQIYYKYAFYYSNKRKKIIIKKFDGNISVNEIDIKDIPDDKDGYEVLINLAAILPQYQDESPDFKIKVDTELETRENPYNKENGLLEADDFIYPIKYLNTSFTTKTKKTFLSKNATCFFIEPKKRNETEIYYKYAVYYSNEHNKIIIKEFDGNSSVNEIDIKDIPHDVDGYEFLRTLDAILPQYKYESPDFKNKVEAELRTRKNPY